ncbi:MAG TPA: MFS transporter [Actinomycetaceae bacterium]|nr:MFS transporter [Actinomycetaceae bacterium]
MTAENFGVPPHRPGAGAAKVIAVLAGAGIVSSTAQTLVVPLIPELPRIFDTSLANASWIITITLLTGAVATPVVGRLADMYGKKRMLLIAVAPFMLGSITCAIATDVGVMVVGRGLQGMAMGVVPLGISLMHDVLPPDRVGSAIALMSSSMGIGGALGLPLAAAVAEFANWRLLFWFTTLAAALLAVAIWRIVPAHPPLPTAHRFDYLGALGLIAGLGALLLGISKGTEWGWASTATLGCFAAAAVVLTVWGWHQLRRGGPLVDLRTARIPAVLLTNIASLLIGFAMYGMNLIVPQIMQLPVETGYGLGQSMLLMGLWLAPMGLGMMAVSGLGARISRVHGPRVTLTLAGVVIAVGYGITALALGTLGNRPPGDADANVWPMLLVMLVSTLSSGCGVGLAFGSMPALILAAVPPSEKAAATGFNSLTRSIGTSTSAAVTGTILGAFTHSIGGAAVPSLTGLIIALLAGCGGAVLAAIIASAIPRTPRSLRAGEA